MATKARAEYTVSVVNDGKGEKTFIRYSDDGGKTFTSFIENGDYGHGRNLFGFNLGIWNITCRVDKTINGYWAVKTDGIPKLCYLWKRRNSAMPAGIYRLSGLIRSDGNCTIELRMGGTPAREGSISVDNEWKPFSVTINNTKALGAPDFGNIETKYLSGTTKVFIKNFMLTMGEDKYDYAPAPEDQDAGTFPGKYIGIISWDKPYPPLDPSAYTWSAFQGQDAELYKLSPLEESAIVGNDGACKVILRYNVTYIAGSKASKYTGNDVTIKVDSRLGTLNFTKKATGEWECVTTISNFTTKNLGSFNVRVMKGAQVLDTRVIPVTYATQALMEANQKLGEVVASVRGVSKLIHNMFVGSTFLEPIDGVWSMAGAKVDNALKYNNSNVVFIEEHGQTADTYHSLLFNVSGLAPNTAYTVSVMVRTDNLASFTGGKNGAVLEVTQTTSGQRKRLFDPISIVPLTANTWEKVEHTFTTPATLSSEVVEVKFMLLRNGRLWVSQSMMNQGNAAADYTANIKDIQLSLAQIKVTANTISQSITDLSTGLESVGIHLSGTEKKITLHGDTELVDASGNHVAMFKDGKLNTDFINSKKIVTEGLKAGEFDAENATINNLTVGGKSVFKGDLEGVSGTFTSLNCLDKNKNKAGGIKFGSWGNKSYMVFTSDFGMLGYVEGDLRKRYPNFYATNLYCNSQFGHKSRVCAVVRDDEMSVYNDGHIDSNGIRIDLSFGYKEINGRKTHYYKIPMYSPGFGGDDGTVIDIDNPKAQYGTQAYYDELPVGVPIDVVIFNCTQGFFYDFIGMGYGKSWRVLNANNNSTIHICDHGGVADVEGGFFMNYLYINPRWMSPLKDGNFPGAGVVHSEKFDMNW